MNVLWFFCDFLLYSCAWLFGRYWNPTCHFISLFLPRYINSVEQHLNFSRKGVGQEKLAPQKIRFANIQSYKCSRYSLFTFQSYKAKLIKRTIYTLSYTVTPKPESCEVPYSRPPLLLFFLLSDLLPPCHAHYFLSLPSSSCSLYSKSRGSEKVKQSAPLFLVLKGLRSCPYPSCWQFDFHLTGNHLWIRRILGWQK